jgi:Ca2+-binding RTX toxin-like protein
MPRILLTAAVALAAVVAMPSIAHGATIHQDGRTPHRILLQDATGEANLVSVEGSRSVVLHDLNMPIEIAGAPTCMAIDTHTVSCSAVRRLELDLGAGQDHARIDSTLPVEVDGGAGNDRYNATATGGPSQVSFAGGIGLDTVNYFYATEGVNVSVDLEGGDGRPGDDDRIHRDVESVIGSTFGDVLTGSPRTVQLSGQDGDDLITGGTGAEVLMGGGGNDRIEARDGAADSVDCGHQTDSALVDQDAEGSITGCETVAF